MSSTVFGNAGTFHVQNFLRVNLDDTNVNVVVGVDEHTLPEWLTVYPSPALDVIHISLLKEMKTAVKLYDITGRLIEKNLFSQKNNLLDVSNLPAGIYHLNISAEGKNYDVKVVVGK